MNFIKAAIFVFFHYEQAVKKKLMVHTLPQSGENQLQKLLQQFQQVSHYLALLFHEVDYLPIVKIWDPPRKIKV